MGVYNLEKIFKPGSIALIGASKTSGSIGRSIMENLIQGGYNGEIFPVNPKYSKVSDKMAFPSLSKTGKTVDLAIFATPIATVPDIIKECVETGAGGAIIISAATTGF